MSLMKIVRVDSLSNLSFFISLLKFFSLKWISKCIFVANINRFDFGIRRVVLKILVLIWERCEREIFK